MLKIIEKLKQLLGLNSTKKPEMPEQGNSISSNFNLTEIQPIEGTPLASARNQKGKFMLIMGRSLISEKQFNQRSHAEAYARKTEWWTILNVVGVYVENYINELNKNQK